MPQPTPQWKSFLPEFLLEVTSAQSEADIKNVCETFKRLVCECYPNTPSSRDRPMSEARKAVREEFPAKETKETSPDFPYFFTETGKGRNPRWEHLAIKHLEAEWNRKGETVKTDPVEVVKTETTILDEVGLTTDEREAVNQAIADTDVKEWVKQALLQRANTINSLRSRLDEDLSMIPSQTLMSDKKYRTNPVACRELTTRAVRAIKAFNIQSPEHRWCITNKLISELTGNTVKAIARAIEGMDIESYNQSMELQPVNNRLTKAAIGDIKDVVSIKDVLGVDE